MSPAELKKRLSMLADDAVVTVTDYTGTEDHYEAKVVTAAFAGKSRMERHRMVFDLVRPEMDSGEVHALTLKTLTPGE